MDIQRVIPSFKTEKRYPLIDHAVKLALLQAKRAQEKSGS